MKRRIVPLSLVRDDGALITLGSIDPLPGRAGGATFRYATRTGALLRIGDMVCGAFDREHGAIFVPTVPGGPVTLEVERRSLPTTGLPPRDGPRWKRMVARAAQRPARTLVIDDTPFPSVARARDANLACVGHSHLDVAWLWTYDEAARKAERTLATALRQLDADPSFVFTQSQPQLFAWIAERDGALFERLRVAVRAGRIDVSGAPLWVEPDCNVPSGESLLAQLRLGIRYCEREFGVTPSVAWLPDTFGFANTLPSLLSHAGITAFGTTKLGWNDTNVFAHARFIWIGPDGSRLRAASIASIEGEFDRPRVERARSRDELLLVGRGDGGGGATDLAVAEGPRFGRWTSLAEWFAAWPENEALPQIRDELYLEGHRGVFTTHHGIKARNAALERALGETETVLAWARTLRASPYFLTEGRAQLDRAWALLARGQFHDVLPGTSIAPVFADAHRDYDEAERLVATCDANARAVLPAAARTFERAPIAPTFARGTYAFENEILRARTLRDGTLIELCLRGGPNLVRRAGRLALYVDRPKKWDAWNIDRSYRKRRLRVRSTGSAIVDGGLEVRFAFGASLAVARMTLTAGEPFLRVDYAIDWRERHALLRVENELAFVAERARFGSPHGCVDRTPSPRTSLERAKFEACGQRYARLDAAAGGLALLALDTYGWSVERGRRATEFGHSLLRGPTWPDPSADAGEHALALAYLPFAALGMGELEAQWLRFARVDGVPMFVPDDPAVLVVATALAADEDAVVLRVRECDGRARAARIRCGARVRSVASADALERPIEREVGYEDGEILASFEPFEIRTFLIRPA